MLEVTVLWQDLIKLPNLLSLSRIFITPIIGYYLWKDDIVSTYICFGLLVLASITDGLDGYTARKMKLTSELGHILDPLADKVMATGVVILLVFFRDMPIWLAGIIVGRDLLILIAAAVLLRGQKVVVPSNLTGKYTFTALSLLLGSYIIHYDFGIISLTYISLVLIALSLVGYIRVFLVVRRGEKLIKFEDRLLYKVGRTVLTISFLIVLLGKLYLFWFVD